MSMHFSFESDRNPIDAGRAGGGANQGRGPDERPFRVLVIADLSGRAGRGVAEPLAGRAPIKVDLDTLDGLPGRLGTRVRVRQDPPYDLPVSSIDDLHPDEIHDHSELFAALRDLRTRVKDPGTFEAAAEEVLAWATGTGPIGSEVEPKPSATATPESEFAALLSQNVGRGPSKETASVETLLQHIIGPYVVPDRDPRQDELITLVNEAIAREMRGLLHTPAWRETEAAWRGLHTLVTGLELGEDLELFALDASPAELAADGPALEDALVTKPVQTAGGVPWALILHLHDHTEADLPVLGTLAPLAHRAGAPLITSAEPALFGVPGWPERPDPGDWGAPAGGIDALRSTPAADAVCVTMPRYLVRLPYAPGFDETDRFDFDETNGAPTPDALLWGSGAVLVGLLLGGAYTQAGWSIQPIGGGTVDDLPVVSLGRDAGMIPCAEAWLSDRHAAALADRGLTPLVSVQNRGAVQVAGLRALSGGPLACRW